MHRGEPIETEVVGKTDFGVFVKVLNGMEGLIHKSNLANTENSELDNILEAIKIGDKITAVVITVAEDKRRLALSVKDYLLKQSSTEMGEYLTKDSAEDNKYTLADIIKKN